jgi:kumamolisin
VIRNTGFETGGGNPWKSTAGVINTAAAGEKPRTGSFYAWLDGFGHIHTDTLTQTLKFPKGCNNGTLSFFLKITTAEQDPTVFDTLTIKMGNTKLATFSNRNASNYKAHSIKMTGLSGQTLTLSFTGKEDTSLATSFILDDVFLNVAA